MKISVNYYDFRQAFEGLRPNNFSSEGLRALFDYLEEYEQDCGEELELDVIALCCEYTEWEDKKEFKSCYPNIKFKDIHDYCQFIDIDGTRFITNQF